MAVKDAIAAVKERNETSSRASRPRRPKPATCRERCDRQRRRMTTRHARHERMARREAIIEGITALETVYRDALAGPDAPAANLDRAPPRVEPARV